MVEVEVGRTPRPRSDVAAATSSTGRSMAAARATPTSTTSTEPFGLPTVRHRRERTARRSRPARGRVEARRPRRDVVDVLERDDAAERRRTRRGATRVRFVGTAGEAVEDRARGTPTSASTRNVSSTRRVSGSTSARPGSLRERTWARNAPPAPRRRECVVVRSKPVSPMPTTPSDRGEGDEVVRTSSTQRVVRVQAHGGPNVGEYSAIGDHALGGLQVGADADHPDDPGRRGPGDGTHSRIGGGIARPSILGR